VSNATARAFGGLYGRQRFQPLFRRLHRGALVGLNYGNEDPHLNGEYALLDRLVPGWPEAPVVFDVGAFHGDWTSAVLERFPRAMLYVFEPLSGSFAFIEERLGSRARLEHCALGAAEGSAAMWAPAGTHDWASLYKRDLSRFQRVADPVETVQVRRLDDVCVRHDVGHIDLLKIDAEGNELAVLQGAEAMLTRGAIDLIQFEFGGTAIDSRIFLRDIIRELAPAYRVHRMLRDGVVEVMDDEAEEIFTYANYLASRAG
jgi:FkbM family methyltransferase